MEKKKWNEMSEDEVKNVLQQKADAEKPAREAVSVMDEELYKIYRELGIHTTGDVMVQAELMNIKTISLANPGAEGLYVFVWKKGDFYPYAYIKEPYADSTGRYSFKAAKWNAEKDDYDEPERVKIG